MPSRPDVLERIDDGLARLPFVRGRKPEPLPITLDRKRIYVLPTRQGLLVGVLVLGMLLGALNYNNNPGLMLAFLLAAIVHNGVVLAHLRLSGLRLTALHAEPVHAGESLALRLRLESGKRSREGVQVRAAAGEAVDLPASLHVTGEDAEIELTIPTTRRGLMDLGRLRLSTTRPLGLARAWSWWRPQQRVLVYPALERNGPPLPGAASDGARQPRAQRSGEDTHHLRDYRNGDSPRQIAWKASARLDRLMVREYEAGVARDVMLDWQSLRQLPHEQRIARLARWVVEAEREGRRFRLQIPGTTLGPARGPEHRHACLRALALLPEAGA
ncbi:DUF58 domain-containing protein [Silanimonas sp.]|uniref:DUF58 domain-containing protein n=1 Tax=Silanimonas sp. TaxID=1929290 RepID=UPI0022C58C87|nr:DUF58 domain-containing protein [Silanimonas sp.]MCZ8114503.1 DUF58 domain-containing protein [Silanimonas sp.]